MDACGKASRWMRTLAEHKVEHLASMEAQRHTRIMPLRGASMCPRAPEWVCAVSSARTPLLVLDYRVFGLSDAQPVA